MGHKGQKRARKTLQYYRVHYNLTKPFTVLCDGTVLHYAQTHGIFLKDALARLLLLGAEQQQQGKSNSSPGTGQGIFLATTKCIVHELRALGPDFKSAASFAKRANTVDCAHEGDVVEQANRCLLQIVRTANRNQQGLVVASNDRVLIDRLQSFPNVMLVFCVNQTLQLARPSVDAKEKVKYNEGKKLDHHLAEEQPMIQVQQQPALRERAYPSDRHQTTKRRGPNPLSVKRKQPKLAAKSNADPGAISKSKRVRRRK